VGHAYATVNADALARWHRLVGDEVFFLTGTDEHGQKVARAAEENGVSPEAWTDRLAPRFRDAWRDLDISNDDFIRTTEPRHRRAVQHFLGRIYNNGWITKDTYRGLYCVACEQYYAEDELLDGTLCPVHHRPEAAPGAFRAISRRLLSPVSPLLQPDRSNLPSEALTHFTLRSPSSSQFAATFLLGCTRGGSPGIFG